jgi:hypothetical protein
MLLKQGRDPRTVWRMAMVCLLAFFALPLITRSAPSNWQDLVDGVRGALLGATLALMAVSGLLKRRGGYTDAASLR